jgi:hypothetical protein
LVRFLPGFFILALVVAAFALEPEDCFDPPPLFRRRLFMGSSAGDVVANWTAGAEAETTGRLGVDIILEVSMVIRFKTH